MHLVILIPCLNEAPTIGEVISAVPKDIPGVDQTDIVVIDDGSTDESAEIAKSNGAMVVSHPSQLGVGVAFNTGLNKSIELGADLVVNIDGDGQFNPQDIVKLIQPIMDDQADFVTASRFKDKRLIPQMPNIKELGNKFLARLISLLSGQKFHDVSCGFRAYSQETMLQLNLIGKFTYTQETFLDLAFKDLRIMEIPIKVKGEREHGKSRVARNIWIYAVNSAKIIFRSFRDYKPLRFFGILSCAMIILSLGLGIFFFSHYLQTGRFSGHLWAGFSSAFLFILGFLFFVTGLLADMFDRIRLNQEKLLYIEKKKIISNHDM
ncbi:MAG: glycosyltransferase family 2 protein [Desulfohalobiaceae bacterium]|nr:glycosyltransferase family 2 protein [Desulfohalobiaceae bacterium]